MSKSETVRAFVNERLAVAAEEIFALFEWIIAEYEEKLSRSQEEYQRSNQELMDSTLHLPGVQISAVRSETHNTDYILVKDEPQELQVKQQEDAFPAHSLQNCFVLIEHLAASSVTCVKIEESSLLQPKPNEHNVETQGEDMSADPYSQTGEDMSADPYSQTGEDMSADPYSQTGADMESSDNDNNEDWRAPHEQDGDLDHQVYSRDRNTVIEPRRSRREPRITRRDPRISLREPKINRRKPKRSRREPSQICKRTFTQAASLIRHGKCTNGEHGPRPSLIPNPESSVICVKTEESSLHSYIENDNRGIPGEQLQIEEDKDLHKRDTMIPNRRKPFCPICDKTFKSTHQVKMHFVERHSDIKPFSCPICEKSFARRCVQTNHMKTHREGRPDHRPTSLDPVIPNPESSVVGVKKQSPHCFKPNERGEDVKVDPNLDSCRSGAITRGRSVRTDLSPVQHVTDISLACYNRLV